MKFQTKFRLMIGGVGICAASGIGCSIWTDYDFTRGELKSMEAQKGGDFAKQYASGLLGLYNGPADRVIMS